MSRTYKVAAAGTDPDRKGPEMGPFSSQIARYGDLRAHC